MYYRRKVALALIQAFGGKLGKLDFQKLLFLLAQTQTKPAYDFVPYKYGCYSFQANADMQTMIHYQQVAEHSKNSSDKPDTWKKADDIDYFAQLSVGDQRAIKQLKEQFGDFTTDKLIAHTYRKFPYYAIHSRIADKMLSAAELQLVSELKPFNAGMGLFSIGYEGKSLEQYINTLIQHDIRLLCDVRKNSKSMKFGFSKNQLQYACKAVGIEFVHIPNLGIDSDKRQTLNTQEDYDLLFAEYRSTTLRSEQQNVAALAALVEKHQRVAITCFEANIHQCHRKHLADAVVALPGWCHAMEHI
jgi:uncharacterized protein (DUF488 family)